MITYKLKRYSGSSENEETVFENEDENLVANKAIEISKENNEYSRKYNIGIYTYRLERWLDGEHDGGWRFFNNGEEFTQRIRNAIKNETTTKC